MALLEPVAAGRILLVSADDGFARELDGPLTSLGCLLEVRPAIPAAVEALLVDGLEVSGILLDVEGSLSSSGRLFEVAARFSPPIPIVLLLGQESPEAVRQAVESGAFDHCIKRGQPLEELVLLVWRALAARGRHRGRRGVGAEIDAAGVGGPGTTGHDRRLLELIQRNNAWLTERVREATDQLVKANDRLRAVGEVAKVLTSLKDLDVILHEVMERAKEVVGAEASALMLLDDETGDLVFRVAHGEKGEAVKSMRIKAGEGVAGWVARERQSLLITDAYSDPRFNREYDQRTGFRTRDILAAPMLLHDRLIGVVEVINRAGERPFDASDLELFNHFASFGAIAIENGRAYDKVKREKTDLERRVRELEVRVDQAEKLRQVKAITESDYFLSLRDRAEAIRRKF